MKELKEEEESLKDLLEPFYWSEAKTYFFPLEMFDEQIPFDWDPEEIIQEKQLKREKLMGYSKYLDLNDDKWEECEIKSYDPSTWEFTIEWKSGRQKKVRRLNLIYEFEDIAQHKIWIEKAQKL